MIMGIYKRRIHERTFSQIDRYSAKGGNELFAGNGNILFMDIPARRNDKPPF
jgi:hypothetical protein